MDNVTHLGLDVHKDSIAVGLLRPTQQILDGVDHVVKTKHPFSRVRPNV